jgi:hypothetical protein
VGDRGMELRAGELALVLLAYRNETGKNAKERAEGAISKIEKRHWLG